MRRRTDRTDLTASKGVYSGSASPHTSASAALPAPILGRRERHGPVGQRDNACQEPGNGQMKSWHDVDLLCPVCEEWRASGAATTVEDFTSGDAPSLDEGCCVLSCGHEVGTSRRRLGPRCPVSARPQIRLLMATDRRPRGPGSGPRGTWLTCAGSASVSHVLFADQSCRRPCPVGGPPAGCRPRLLNAAGQAGEAAKVRLAISAGLIELYAAFCGHDPVTAATYINDQLLVSTGRLHLRTAPSGGDAP